MIEQESTFDLIEEVITTGKKVLPLVSDDEIEDYDLDLLESILETEEYYIGYLKWMKAGHLDNKTVYELKPNWVMDRLVLGVLISTIKETLSQQRYFSKSCFSNYTQQNDILKKDYFNEIKDWQNLEGIIYINLYKSLIGIDRSRLLKKVGPLLHNDDYAVKLLSDYLHAPIFQDDESGNEKQFKILSTGIPPVRYISDVLLNLMIDDIDKKIEERMPHFKYVRFCSEIIIPIYNLRNEPYNELFQIFHECNFNSYTAKRACRDSAPIIMNDDLYMNVDEYGRCHIHKDDEMNYAYLVGT